MARVVKVRAQLDKMDKMKTSRNLNYLSLAIAAIALTIIFLFFLPWINDPASDGERVLAGIDVAVQSTLLTEDDIPSGILFIIPLVAGAILYQNLRRLSSPYRPSRRITNAGMLVIGIAALLVWAWNFANAASDCFQSGDCIALTEEQVTYTPEDVIRNLYDTNLWIYLGLSLLSLLLPFWDTRPEEPRKETSKTYS